MKALRILIVDDEPLARAGLRDALAGIPDVEVCGESGDGVRAVDDVLALEPDLLLLDVQMPELDGFEVVTALRDAGVDPAVVFVTAHDEYALRAFEVHAVDYVLKPVDAERVRGAVARVRAQLERDRGLALAGQLERLLAEVPRRAYARRLAVKGAGRVTFVPVNDVDWIEAAGNYAKLHVGRESWLIRATMASLEDRLDPEQFARVHRSTIVNLDRVKEVQPWFKGDYLVVLRDGTQLSLTRQYRDRLPG
jgi:two-component system LytT family response regulator